MSEVEISRCRGCGDPIVWAVTPAGARIPLDPEPQPDGNLELVRMVGGVLEARVLTPERKERIARAIMTANRNGEALPLNLYVSHFATCRQADTFRRRRSPGNGNGAAAA